MSLKLIKKQIEALREEIGRQSGFDWITVRAPETATQEQFEIWLADNIGTGWRRNIIVRLDNGQVARPSVEYRTACRQLSSLFHIHFSCE